MHLSIGKVSTSTRYHLKNEFAYISCDWFSFTRINALKTDQRWLIKWRTTFSIEKFHIVWSRESKRHRHKSKSNDRKRNQKRNYGKWKAQIGVTKWWLTLSRRPVFLVGFSKSYNLPHDSHIQTLFDLKKFVSENDENFHE